MVMILNRILNDVFFRREERVCTIIRRNTHHTKLVRFHLGFYFAYWQLIELRVVIAVAIDFYRSKTRDVQ